MALTKEDLQAIQDLLGNMATKDDINTLRAEQQEGFRFLEDCVTYSRRLRPTELKSGGFLGTPA